MPALPGAVGVVLASPAPELGRAWRPRGRLRRNGCRWHRGRRGAFLIGETAGLVAPDRLKLEAVGGLRCQLLDHEPVQLAVDGHCAGGHTVRRQLIDLVVGDVGLLFPLQRHRCRVRGGRRGEGRRPRWPGDQLGLLLIVAAGQREGREAADRQHGADRRDHRPAGQNRPLHEGPVHGGPLGVQHAGRQPARSGDGGCRRFGFGDDLERQPLLRAAQERLEGAHPQLGVRRDAQRQIQRVRSDQERQPVVRVVRGDAQPDRGIAPVGDLQEVASAPPPAGRDRGDLGLQPEDPADLQIAFGQGRNGCVDDRFGSDGERERAAAGALRRREDDHRGRFLLGVHLHLGRGDRGPLGDALAQGVQAESLHDRAQVPHRHHGRRLTTGLDGQRGLLEPDDRVGHREKLRDKGATGPAHSCPFGQSDVPRRLAVTAFRHRRRHGTVVG